MATEKSVLAVIRASRPSFRNGHDKVAFAVHASFLAAGFVLTATGPPAFDDNCRSSDEVGIEGWNEVEDQYAFVYVNPEKDNKKVLVKCLVMGDKLMVDALSDGASEPVHLDINVDECVTETDATDYNSQYKNLGKLVRSLESDLLCKLEGGSDGGHLKGPSSSHASEERTIIVDGPTLQDPPPRFVVPPVYPIGGSDLFPSGGAGIYPSRGGFGGGSMLVGPEDPRWFGGGGAFSDVPGGPGGLAGGVPPGARFDPYGPPGVPGFEPGNFGSPRRRTPRGGTHPDLQPGGGGFDFI